MTLNEKLLLLNYIFVRDLQVLKILRDEYFSHPECKNDLLEHFEDNDEEKLKIIKEWLNENKVPD